MSEPWLSKYRGKYDAGYEALKKKRLAGAKKIGVVPDTAELPAMNELVKPWDSLSEIERAQSLRSMEGYAGMVDNMDYHFGRVVNFLKDIGQLDNTIIIFLSDNGSNPWYSEDYPGNRGSKWFDPGETRDLSDDTPEMLSELKDAWQAYAKDVGVVQSK